MSYNLFSNTISTAISNNNNILSLIQQEIEPFKQKLNYIFSNVCYIDVQISGIEGKYILSNHKKSIINNHFVDSTFNTYILNNKIIIKKSDAWFYILFNTDINLIINLPIDLDVYIENEIFITIETKYFGSYSYPKNINITYI